MIREIFTLLIDGVPVLYYVQFNKDRQRFSFQAGFKNRSAPSFTIIVRDDQLITEPVVRKEIVEQAVKKVKEIVADKIFDRF
jgi:hypothetical protein